MIKVFPDMHCIGANGYCFKNSPCTNEQVKIQFTLGANAKYFEIDSSLFMIPGTEVGDSANTCYFAFFKQDISQYTNWYFGNIFM